MKAIQLAKWAQAMADEPKRAESKRIKHAETAAELVRLVALNQLLVEALKAQLDMQDKKDVNRAYRLAKKALEAVQNLD